MSRFGLALILTGAVLAGAANASACETVGCDNPYLKYIVPSADQQAAQDGENARAAANQRAMIIVAAIIASGLVGAGVLVRRRRPQERLMPQSPLSNERALTNDAFTAALQTIGLTSDHSRLLASHLPATGSLVRVSSEALRHAVAQLGWPETHAAAIWEAVLHSSTPPPIKPSASSPG